MKIPNSLEFNEILNRLAAYTVSPSGEKAVRCIVPSDNTEQVQELMRLSVEAETLLLHRPSNPMRAFYEIKEELKRMKTGASLGSGELLRLNSVFLAAKAAAPLAKDEETQRIPALAQLLFYDETLMRRVEESIVAEDEIADGASAELSRIRRAIRRENESIREKLQGMLRSDSKFLQDNIITQRNGRYVVPVKAEYKGAVSGIVHEKSASGATLFVEPAAVVESNNRIRELQGAEQQEIARILKELTALFARYQFELRNDLEVLTELDVIFAKASLGIAMKAIPAEFTADGAVEINQGRHPLIDPERVVPVSVTMPEEIRALIITGPNTGGKTVTLKCIGLFAAMAQCGLFVPAAYPLRLPVFDGIYADIGDEQSIEQSLSTFSAHMKSIIYALRHAGKRSLVLFDELGAGTDPQEGSAIAQAVLQELGERGCHLVATTHISDLKAFANAQRGFENASMEFDIATLTPTFRLLMGVAGRSNAILISQKLGLPKHIVERAQSYLNEDHVEYSTLIQTAEQAQRRAQKMLDEARLMKEEANREKQKAKSMLQKAEEKRTKVLEQANDKAIEIISDAKDTVEDVISEAKKLRKQGESTQTRTMQKVRGELKEKQKKIESYQRVQKKGSSCKPDDLQVGDDVLITATGTPATVLELPNAKGNVRLQAGIMTVEMHYTELTPAQKKMKSKSAGRMSGVQLNRNRNVSMEVDLHGMAVDEATFLLDKYLDDAFLSGLHEVRVIHGRGTGVLRMGVQKYLRTHPHVQSMRQGKIGEGDIGVTVVTLK